MVAREYCERMEAEWRYLHDMMVESIFGLVDEDRVADAWRESMERGWRRDVDKIAGRDRRAIVEALAATWRAHSTSGVGPAAGSFSIEEDGEKSTFVLHPCGSGQRLVRLGRYEGDSGCSVTDEAHDWSFGRNAMPLHCTYCVFMNERLPIDWAGVPLHPLDPPTDYGIEPCRWYSYKRPEDIPVRFWERHHLTKPDPQ